MTRRYRQLHCDYCEAHVPDPPHVASQHFLTLTAQPDPLSEAAHAPERHFCGWDCLQRFATQRVAEQKRADAERRAWELSDAAVQGYRRLYPSRLNRWMLRG